MGGLNNDGGLFIGWNYVSSNLELQITKKWLGSFGTGMILDSRSFFLLGGHQSVLCDVLCSPVSGRSIMVHVSRALRDLTWMKHFQLSKQGIAFQLKTLPPT